MSGADKEPFIQSRLALKTDSESVQTLQKSQTGQNDTINLQNSITPLQKAVSSTSGAVLTSFFVTPLDVVKVRLQKQVKVKQKPRYRTKPYYVTPLDVAKVRLQAQARPLMPGRCFVYSNGLMDHLCTSCASTTPLECEWYQRPSKPTQFSGTLDAMKKIARTEGLPALWSGLPPTLVMALPATVCYFSLYDALHLRLRDKLGHIGAPMFAGVAARTLVVTGISPLELVRTKIQSENLSYSDVSKAVRSTIAQEGITSLWRGVGATILRDVPFSGIYWGCYEILKDRLIRAFALRETNFSISFISGWVAGSAAALVTVPFDVIKTHRQIEIGERMSNVANGNGKQAPTSTFALMRRLVKEQGPRSLWAGTVPRLVKIAPACAIMIGTYEYGKLFFHRRNTEGMAF